MTDWKDYVNWTLAVLTAFGAMALGNWWMDAAAARQDEQARLARRNILCRMLARELQAIPDRYSPYEPGKVNYRPPIHLGAMAQLLDGTTLITRDEEALMEALVVLQVAIAIHNDYAKDINQALLTATSILPEISDGYLRHLHAVIGQQYERVLAAKREVLRFLPAQAVAARAGRADRRLTARFAR